MNGKTRTCHILIKQKICKAANLTIFDLFIIRRNVRNRLQFNSVTDLRNVRNRLQFNSVTDLLNDQKFKEKIPR